MSKWHNIGSLANFEEGCQWQVQVGDRPVALFKYEGDYYAMKNSCLHQGWPLAEGNVKNYMVECPLHGWVYDFRDGKCLSTPGRFTKTFKVRIKGKNLEINMDEKENP